MLGQFDCEYLHNTFDIDPVTNTRVKKVQHYIQCRIALKIE